MNDPRILEQPIMRFAILLSVLLIGCIATVSAGDDLNGQDLGMVWTAPWNVEITQTVCPGDNDLEVEVANLWPNRVIGDGLVPKERRFTITNVKLPVPPTPESPKNRPTLLPSGLLGPVTLQAIN